MATKHPDSAPRLGGVLISNQVVAELLEQLRIVPDTRRH